jgi:outer membrane lipoprotein-sorting protein
MSFKPVKYLSVLLLAVIIATVCLACKDSEASPSAEQVLENTLAAQADVASFRLDATLTVDVQSSDTEGAISLDANCAVDLADREAEAAADLSLQMTGLAITAEMQAYVVDNYTYIMTSMFGQTEWTKQAITADTWQTIEDGQYQIQGLLESVAAELVKEENLNGVGCYVLELTPDLDQLQQALMEQPGIGEGLAEMPDLDSMVQEMTLKIWVDKETFFLMKANISMTLVMDPETMGMSEGEGTATIELSLELLAYDYNQPISIDLPSEAQSATEGSSDYELPFF